MPGKGNQAACRQAARVVPDWELTQRRAQTLKSPTAKYSICSNTGSCVLIKSSSKHNNLAFS
jgi:hypothetical protein